ncbi:MAG: hypothetical protein U0414_12970 [Polyangiaceae bacterium]
MRGLCQSERGGGVPRRVMSRTSRVFLSAALALGLSSCGATTVDPGAGRETTAKPAAPREPISVRVIGEHHAPGGPAVPMEQNSVVKSGDEYSLTVELSRPAFVHLVEMHATGGGTILYPVEKDPREAAALHKVPGDPGAVLFFNEDKGPEVLLLVVTERPLAEAAPDLFKTLKEIESSPATAAAKQTFTIELPPGEDGAPVVAPPASASVAPVASTPPTAAPTVPAPPIRAPSTGSSPVGCPPVVVAKLEMTARGGACASGGAKVKVTAKGSGRRAKSGELIRAVADESGVLTFPIVLDHQ